ncbi:MAG: MFS transporter [Pedosphaera sp.]|nr:MFS transporter [Pedosphaera sp.]
MKKPSLLVIFLTVFLDLVGFGIVLPLLPLYSDKFGADGWMIGVIMASYSAMQFLFAPAWGRLSDRIGRRPVMLVSTAVAAISYAIFAIGSGIEDPMLALGVLLISRALAGVCGANITVAQACIADVTPPEERSKKMGLIGMAFGLGFIFGPALGGVAVKSFGISGPGWVAAALCAANFFLALAILPETRPANGAVKSVARPRFNQWAHVLARPQIGLLVLVFFLATFCFTCFETTLSLLVAKNFNLVPIETGASSDLHTKDKFGDAATSATILFTYCGLIGAFVQGGPLGKILKRLGERRLISLSLLLVGVSLIPLPFIHGEGHLSWAALWQAGSLPWWVMIVVLGGLSVGSSLARPPLFGLISILTPSDEQGETLGVAQSVGSLARILGPIFAGSLFNFTPFNLPVGAVPYLIAGSVALIAAVLAWRRLRGAEANAAMQVAR